MKGLKTQWTLAGAILLTGLVLALGIFACKNDPGVSKPEYTITKGTVSPAAGGDFTISPTKAREGATVNLELTLRSGYRLNRWTVSPPGLLSASDIKETRAGSGKYTFSMPANDIRISVALRAGTTGGGPFAISKGEITGTGDFTIEPESAMADETVTLTVTITDPGYEFKSWSCNPPSVRPEETSQGSGVFTFAMPNRAVTVNATFMTAGTETFTISKLATFNPATAHGDFSFSPDEAIEGEEITLEPDPAAGYRFGNWVFNPPTITATEKATENGIYVFTMPTPGTNVTVSATFISQGSNPSGYAVTKTAAFNPATAHGDFTIEPGMVESGGSVTLTPNPDTDYKFGEWAFSPNTISATETAPGSGVWTVTNITRAFTVSATFLPTKFTITKGQVYGDGSFTINGGNGPVTVEEGEQITLAATAANAESSFDKFMFNPASLEAGITLTVTPCVFAMPSGDITIGAVFTSTSGGGSGTPGTGVKTITVPGPTGKVSGEDGSISQAATRDVLVTVTMAGGTVTNVTLEQAIEWGTWYLDQGPANGQISNMRTATAGLITAIKNANGNTNGVNTSANTTAFTAAWTKADASIKGAVETAKTAINAGKPNRTLTGGGNNPWLADGIPLNGTASATGVGFMNGINAQPGGPNVSTDMKVTVTVTNGKITAIVVEGDDLKCNYSQNGHVINQNLGKTLGTSWVNRIINANDWKAVDTITGSTQNSNFEGAYVDHNGTTVNVDHGIISLRLLKRIGYRAFMKIVNEY